MHDHEADEQLLQTLEQMGVDFHKTRELNYYFEFASEPDANAAQRRLKEKGFDSECLKLDVPWWKKLFAAPKWAVCATENAAIDRQRIKGLTTQFEGIASQSKGRYDGWEANVMEDDIDVSRLS